MTTKHQATCDCGWTGGPYRSKPQAEYALRQHSCDAQRRRNAAAARNQARLERLARIDRTPKPCTHPDEHGQPRHQHGTYATYTLDKCRCHPCADASATYERQRVRRNAYGRSNLTDATPIRQHIAALTAAGIGLKSITRHSGINSGVISKLVYGDRTRNMPPSRRVRRSTAEKILALDPRDVTLLADGAKIDATGTRRRLQALATLGWSIDTLAREAGMDRQRLDHAMHGDLIVASTARAVTDLYDRLWDTPAPETTKGERISASRTRSRAQRHGWAPPLAWDDHAIDDPDATPFVNEPTSITTRGHGRVNHDALTDCITEWGMTLRQTADRLRVTKGTVEQAIGRLDPHQRDTLRAQARRNAIAQGHDQPTRDGLGLRRTA